MAIARARLRAGMARALAAGLLLWLSGCASQTPTAAQPDRSAPPATEAEPVHRPAAQDYAERARAALEQGQYDAAIATAERGLRVNRYQAELYWLLAQAYSRQGLQEQATNFARLGLRYAGDNAELAAQLQALIGPE